MGFKCERYNDNRAGLVVIFSDEADSENYFSGDSVNDALEHFNLFVLDNTIYERTDDAMALETIGIQSVEEASELRSKIDEIINTYNDDQAAENSILFPLWQPGITYSVGDRVRYNGGLYKVIQLHVSQADWTPDFAVSLFATIIAGEDAPKEWVRPDSTNPYMTGDRVIYNGVVYESLIDNNVWSPSDYPAGWAEVA